MRVLITGGLGFLGGHVAEHFVKIGAEVVVYDTGNRDSSDHWDFGVPQIIHGNVIDRDKLVGVMSRFKPSIIVHCAAVAGVEEVSGNPIGVMETNFLGTYHVTDVMNMFTDCKHFVYFSSSEVYGQYSFQDGEHEFVSLGSPEEGRWSYAVSKFASEHWVTLSCPMKCTILRPFNIFGPRQIGDGAIKIFIGKALRNEDIIIYGNGQQLRSWCYIDDFMEGFKKAFIDEGGIYNIGNPHNVSTTEGLANRIIRKTNSKSKVIFEDHPGVDIQMRVPDITKLHMVSGFSPEVDLDEGLEKTIEWYRRVL